MPTPAVTCTADDGRGEGEGSGGVAMTRAPTDGPNVEKAKTSMQAEPAPERTLSVVRRVISDTSEADRIALLAWAEELQRLRDSTLPVTKKARMAIRASLRAEVSRPLLRVLAREGRDLGIRSKKILWDDRGWAGRLALIGVTLGTVLFSGEGAGIAALGTAIGVPLWLVLGAGGSLLGCLIDGLRRKTPPTTTYTVVEAVRVPDQSGSGGER